MTKFIAALAVLLFFSPDARSGIFDPTPNWSIYKDISYGPHPDEKADLYLLPGYNHPLVVFIHGGGWAAGDKSTYAGYYANKYGAKGISVISINYRLANTVDPSSQWPAQLQDAQMAMRWIRTYAPYWGIDPNRICAFGDSAGAHLALFLGSLKTSRPGDRSAYFPAQSPAANCVVDMFGPSDLTDPQELTVLNGAILFGGKTYQQAPALYADASPILSATWQSAPTLFIQGYWDTVVFPSQSTAMASKLMSLYVPVQMIPFFGGHWFQYLQPTSEKTNIDNKAVNWVTGLLRP